MLAWLTLAVIPVCLLMCWEMGSLDGGAQVKLLVTSLLAMEAVLALVFLLMDLLAFYLAFEFVLFPTFLVVGVWGSRGRVALTRAAFRLFLFTLAGGIAMLVAMLLVWADCGSLSLPFLHCGAMDVVSSCRGCLLWQWSPLNRPWRASSPSSARSTTASIPEI